MQAQLLPEEWMRMKNHHNRTADCSPIPPLLLLTQVPLVITMADYSNHQQIPNHPDRLNGRAPEQAHGLQMPGSA